MTLDELRQPITDLANDELDKGKVTAQRLWLAVVRRHKCPEYSDSEGIAYCLSRLLELTNGRLRDYSRPLPPIPELRKLVDASPDMSSVIHYADELDVVFARPWDVNSAELKKSLDFIEREAEELEAKANKIIAFTDKIRPLRNAGETLGAFLKRHPEFEAESNELFGPSEFWPSLAAAIRAKRDE